MATIKGTPYNDVLQGTNYADKIIGLPGDDVLYGKAGADTLYGGSDWNPHVSFSGNDVLNGGAGPDTMYGWDSNDTYYVDTMSDKVIEYLAHGIDHVYSSVSTSYKWLPANVENLTLTGTAYYGDGNDLNNVIYGNSSGNSLWGYGGNDYINGLDGNDLIYGSGGSDTLIGWGGNDTVYGHEGSDLLYGTYGYDVLYGGEGDDWADGWTENDSIYGEGGNDSLEGGNGNDYINGGTGNDKLDGEAGVDTSYGGTGDDHYYIDTLSDKVIEYANQGNDAVFSSVSTSYKWLPDNVESLTLTGTAYYGDGNDLDNFIAGNDSANSLYGYGGSDHLYGEGGNDYLYGGDGPDAITGGTGADTIYGGAGNDDFIFTDLSGATIKDFSFTDDDEFYLYGQPGKAFEQGLVWTGGVLNPAWYFEGSNGNGAFNLSGIYLQTVDANTGNLWYNPTSNIGGDSTLFATVDVVGTNVTDLSAADFALA